VPFFFLDDVEKFCRAWQAADDNIAMRIACWIPKATDTYNM